MRIVLLGPPGAGKGTHAKLLKDDLGLAHVSTGDILREEMENKTPLGKEAKKFVDEGTLVPDDMITKIIENKLTNDKKLQEGFVLDGYPRTRTQARDLDSMLKKLNKPLDYVLYLQCSLPVVTFRLTGRRVCRQCGALFHMINKPPKQSDTCDECGGTLYQRPDDKEATIKKRMVVYDRNTAPIIEYYKLQNKLKRIDADKDSRNVHSELMKLFHENRRVNQNKIAGRN